MKFDFSGKLKAGLERGRKMFNGIGNADPKCSGCGSAATKAISPLQECDGCEEKFCADCLKDGKCSQCRLAYKRDAHKNSDGLDRGNAMFKNKLAKGLKIGSVKVSDDDECNKCRKTIPKGTSAKATYEPEFGGSLSEGGWEALFCMACADKLDLKNGIDSKCVMCKKKLKADEGDEIEGELYCVKCADKKVASMENSSAEAKELAQEIYKCSWDSCTDAEKKDLEAIAKDRQKARKNSDHHKNCPAAASGNADDCTCADRKNATNVTYREMDKEGKCDMCGKIAKMTELREKESNPVFYCPDCTSHNKKRDSKKNVKGAADEPSCAVERMEEKIMELRRDKKDADPREASEIQKDIDYCEKRLKQLKADAGMKNSSDPAQKWNYMQEEKCREILKKIGMDPKGHVIDFAQYPQDVQQKIAAALEKRNASKLDSCSCGKAWPKDDRSYSCPECGDSRYGTPSKKYPDNPKAAAALKKSLARKSDFENADFKCSVCGATPTDPEEQYTDGGRDICHDCAKKAALENAGVHANKTCPKCKKGKLQDLGGSAGGGVGLYECDSCGLEIYANEMKKVGRDLVIKDWAKENSDSHIMSRSELEHAADFGSSEPNSRYAVYCTSCEYRFSWPKSDKELPICPHCKKKCVGFSGDGSDHYVNASPNMTCECGHSINSHDEPKLYGPCSECKCELFYQPKENSRSAPPDCELCGGGNTPDTGSLVPMKDAQENVWFVCKQCAKDPAQELHNRENALSDKKCPKCGGVTAVVTSDGKRACMDCRWDERNIVQNSDTSISAGLARGKAQFSSKENAMCPQADDADEPTTCSKGKELAKKAGYNNSTRPEQLGPCVNCGASAAACRKSAGVCCGLCAHHNLENADSSISAGLARGEAQFGNAEDTCPSCGADLVNHDHRKSCELKNSATKCSQCGSTDLVHEKDDKNLKRSYYRCKSCGDLNSDVLKNSEKGPQSCPVCGDPLDGTACACDRENSADCKDCGHKENMHEKTGDECLKCTDLALSNNHHKFELKNSEDAELYPHDVLPNSSGVKHGASKYGSQIEGGIAK